MYTCTGYYNTLYHTVLSRTTCLSAPDLGVTRPQLPPQWCRVHVGYSSMKLLRYWRLASLGLGRVSGCLPNQLHQWRWTPQRLVGARWWCTPHPPPPPHQPLRAFPHPSPHSHHSPSSPPPNPCPPLPCLRWTLCHHPHPGRAPASLQSPISTMRGLTYRSCRRRKG